jgi:hypothetical protein
VVSAKKEEERRLRANVVGVGEAVLDQHRANSLNTGWVKVPVKFPALAVVGAEHGRGDARKPLPGSRQFEERNSRRSEVLEVHH